VIWFDVYALIINFYNERVAFKKCHL